MEALIYNSISFLRATYSQYRKAFGLPSTTDVLLVPGVNIPP